MNPKAEAQDSRFDLLKWLVVVLLVLWVCCKSILLCATILYRVLGLLV